MADDVDFANDFIENEISRALGKMQQNKMKKSGSKVCLECGENIPKERRQLGFQHCVLCAEEAERRNSLFANH